MSEIQQILLKRDELVAKYVENGCPEELAEKNAWKELKTLF